VQVRKLLHALHFQPVLNSSACGGGMHASCVELRQKL
jgi:Na+-transporting NADH:ubiquinone oxidoreductase subunit NqrF